MRRTPIQLYLFALIVSAVTSVWSAPPGASLHYHTAPGWSPEFMKRQSEYTIPSLLQFNGKKVSSAKDWRQRVKPELTKEWLEILGRIEPRKEDQKWFGDIRKVKIYSVMEQDEYTRIHLGIPIEVDFLQQHLLLIPKGQGKGPFPAVIAWTSTGPDYAQPEEWWGSWLASHGHVVLTSWSFIRNYRDGKSYQTKVSDHLYERFGRWLPMGKMVHDVKREVEFLKTRPEVDSNRIGFIGFSLSAKTALYVAAFAPEIKATVAIDPHVAMHGDTNYEAPWYLDWRRKFDDINTPNYPHEEYRNTVWSLLDADPKRPGFERNHHELMALCAPRHFLLIGCSIHKRSARSSDDQQSWGYFRRAEEVYELLGMKDRIQYFTTDEGHRAVSPKMNQAWQAFFTKSLSK